jgi:hypothetical protein
LGQRKLVAMAYSNLLGLTLLRSLTLKFVTKSIRPIATIVLRPVLFSRLKKMLAL